MPNFANLLSVAKSFYAKVINKKISYLKNNNNSNIIIVSQRSFSNHKDNNI